VKRQTLALALAVMPAVLAQNVGTFSGPSILTSGANKIGQRAGQDVDLQLHVYANGIYDDGMLPLAKDANGSLVQLDALYGVETGGGIYGRHSFRRSVLGIDYNGNYRHYANLPTNIPTGLNGTNQDLRIGYTWQKSRRLLFDLTGVGGIQNYGTVIQTDGSALVNSNSLLFDNRTEYLQGGMNTTYLLSNRTSFTAGGAAYTVRRRAVELIGVNGYNLNGLLQHQFGRNTIIGAGYQHQHYDYPRAFGESDINVYTFQLEQKIGRNWRLGLSAGAYTSEVQGVENTALDPSIAALLGVGTVKTIFYRTNILPMGNLSLTRQFRRATFYASYQRTVNPGNGVLLTSRQEAYNVGYSYTGIRRWTLSASVASTDFRALGQQVRRYRQINGTASVSYRLVAGMNVVASYTRRDQEFSNTLFQRNASRISFGIYFQPGNIPISFH
jgi:hypothetical protein